MDIWLSQVHGCNQLCCSDHSCNLCFRMFADRFLEVELFGQKPWAFFPLKGMGIYNFDRYCHILFYNDYYQFIVTNNAREYLFSIFTNRILSKSLIFTQQVWLRFPLSFIDI